MHKHSRSNTSNKSGKNKLFSQSKPRQDQGQIRIIGGEWRGRKLPVLLSDGLRPSGDRVRETLFNWLQMDIREARCLDAFAGSGALGLEALSRGAFHCTLLELKPAIFKQLSANIHTLDAQYRCNLVQTNTVEWLRQGPPPNFSPFDGVFLDPPFAMGQEEDTWQACLRHLLTNHWLAENAWVYLEAPRDYPLPNQLPSGWQLDRHKTSGSIQFCLFRGSRS